MMDANVENKVENDENSQNVSKLCQQCLNYTVFSLSLLVYFCPLFSFNVQNNSLIRLAYGKIDCFFGVNSKW